MSYSRVPLLHEVIPLFNVLTLALLEFMDNQDLHPLVCFAAANGSQMLYKYYKKTETSIMYKLAICKSI